METATPAMGKAPSCMKRSSNPSNDESRPKKPSADLKHASTGGRDAVPKSATSQMHSFAEMDPKRMTEDRYRSLLIINSTSVLARLQKTFGEFAEYVQGADPPACEYRVMPSKPRHYRMRVGFGVYDPKRPNAYKQAPVGPTSAAKVPGQDSKLCYVVWTNGRMVRVVQFPIASEAICQAMPRLLSAVELVPVMRTELRAVKFLCSSTGDLLVTLVYRARTFGGFWEHEARKLMHKIGATGILGRSKGVRCAVGKDYVIEGGVKLSDGRVLTYKHVESSFSNPNLSMAIHTLDWLCESARWIRDYEDELEVVDGKDSAGPCDVAQNDDDDDEAKQKEVAETETTFALNERRKLNLLELYCGSGNHTVALAGRHFDFVLGVEIDKRLVKAAAGNLSKNGLNPTQARVVQADSQKFCARVLRRQRWRETIPRDAKSGPIRQDKEPGQRKNAGMGHGESKSDAKRSGLDVQFSAVLVDPPRAGLDATTLASVKKYRHILYISCNPDALERDLRAGLLQTHVPLRCAFLDHFPYTQHVEAAVYLRKRESYSSE